MKQFAICRTYSYFETTSEDIDRGTFDERLERFDEDLRVLLEKYGLMFINRDTRFIPLQKMSVRKCENCDNLMINRDKNPAGFGGGSLWSDIDSETSFFIYDGGTHQDRELCISCLPVSHRWGFFS
jgi:hypothetical protein